MKGSSRGGGREGGREGGRAELTYSITTKISVGVSITSYNRMMCGCVHILRMLISRRTFSPMSNCLILFLFRILMATWKGGREGGRGGAKEGRRQGSEE